MADTLLSRLCFALPHLDDAIAEMRSGYDTYDGNARSLVHDLEYLRNRYASRIEDEAKSLFRKMA